MFEGVTHLFVNDEYRISSGETIPLKQRCRRKRKRGREMYVCLCCRFHVFIAASGPLKGCCGSWCCIVCVCVLVVELEKWRHLVVLGGHLTHNYVLKCIILID